MRRLLVSFTAIFALAGCTFGPSQAELSSADYGVPPTGHEEIIKGFMAGVLKDPYSAQYQFGQPPVKGWTPGNGTGTKFGYISCVYINAKNSFGGFTGNTPYFFTIKNQRVVDYLAGNTDYGRIAVGKVCTGKM